MRNPFNRTQSAQARKEVQVAEAEARKTEARHERERVKDVRQKKKEAVIANPNSRFPPTQVAYIDPSFAEPPPLNYSLRPRIKSISFFWTLVFLDVVCVPIVLYFTLWYLTNLSHNAGMRLRLNKKKTKLTSDFSFQYIHRSTGNSLYLRILSPVSYALEGRF
jgi:hypothetical protein